MKFSLTKEELNSRDFDLDAYFRQVKATTLNNHAYVQAYVDRNHLLDARFPDGIAGIFTLDGSMILDHIPAISPYKRFFCVPGRLSFARGKLLSRGARYLASIDPTLEVSQKLTILQADFNEALAVTQMMSDTGLCYHSREHLSVLDYLKNSSITILNAFVQREKRGHFRLSDSEYLALRTELIYLGRAAVSSYYAFLLNFQDMYAGLICSLTNGEEIIEYACSYLRKEYNRGIFEISFFSRPEASHPVVNMSSMLLYSLKEGQNTDLVIGLPAGATELTLGLHWAISALHNGNPGLMLLPLSLHSSKKQFGFKSSHNLTSHIDFAAQSEIFFRNPGKIVIVDDNSSTGRTIQAAYDLLSVNFRIDKEIISSVAEADIVRTRVDWNHTSRDSIASLFTYEFSVAILPVSRSLNAKNDMREIEEIKILKREYRFSAPMNESKADTILSQLNEQLIANPTERQLDKLTDTNAILTFRHTELSNFYFVPILYEDNYGHERCFASVEHAYQAQKFLPDVINGIDKDHRNALDAILRKRGSEFPDHDLYSAFSNRNMTSGNIKVISDYLQRLGLARPRWDDDKVKIMIDLLLQKFDDVELKTYLVGTNDKYLMEGNVWGDVFWGVCEKRGRNVLGHMLMIIRSHLRGDRG